MHFVALGRLVPGPPHHAGVVHQDVKAGLLLQDLGAELHDGFDRAHITVLDQDLEKNSNKRNIKLDERSFVTKKKCHIVSFLVKIM